MKIVPCSVVALVLLLARGEAQPTILQPTGRRHHQDIVAVQDAVEEADAGLDPLDKVPKTFLIGAGLSSTQAEGAAWEGGKGESAIDFVVAAPDNGYTANGEVSADHYNRYKEDLALAKQMRFTTHRFSISWARIFPDGDVAKPNPEGVKFYDDYIDEVIKNGMEPMVTMYHFDHPMAIERKTKGWTYRDMVDEFVAYAKFLFKTYGHKVKYWNPVNEGNMLCIFLLPELAKAGSTPLDATSFYKCLHNSILAHARTYKAYNDEFRAEQKGLVGTSTLIWPASPVNPNAPEDIEAARICNEVFGATPVHPMVYGGEYPTTTRYLTDKRSKEQGLKESKLPHFTQEEKDELFDGPATDFVAINVYSGYKVTLARNASDAGKRPSYLEPAISDMPEVKVVSGGGFSTIDPGLMRASILWAWESFHLPIVITENGLGDDKGAGVKDTLRAQYHSTALRSIVRTMNEFQIPVISYHAWSLLDIFEFTAGYEKRPFGLIHVDYKGKTLDRTIKESSKVFIEIAETGRVPPATSSAVRHAPPSASWALGALKSLFGR